jgi:16S rRNA (cytosine967-C5)-methyltransferase
VAPPVTRTRQVALQVLREFRAGDLADRALDRLGAGLESRDHAWTQELVYGVFRLRGRLDHHLRGLVRGGTDALDPDVLDTLRIGAYQLLEMGSVPPYAAVSQSVELARWAGAARAAGLVNGVLHSLQRSRDRLRYPDPATDPVGYLAAWGSHPRWLVERWLRRWGLDDTRALVEANNRRPELFVRPLGMAPEEAGLRLRSAGVEARPVPLSPDSLHILPLAGAREALAAVPAVVQDPAATLVVRFASVPLASRVVDLCAAPGGKAAGMAEHAAFVAAADLSHRRLRRLRENIVRTGAEARVGAVVADGRHPPFAPVDAVLLDAPCSGMGTLRRHPDGRWRVKEEDLAALVHLQRELLSSAAALVRPGGVLIYSTCSLEPEENEEQVRDFLLRHPGFARTPPPPEVDEAVLDEAGDLRVLPQKHGFDGSYAARLTRTE